MTNAPWGLPKPPRPSNDETNRTNYLAIVETIRCSTDDDNNYVQNLVRPFHPCIWIDVPGNPSTIRPHASIGGHLFWKFQTTTASTHMHASCPRRSKVPECILDDRIWSSFAKRGISTCSEWPSPACSSCSHPSPRARRQAVWLAANWLASWSLGAPSPHRTARSLP